jgi:hypothetical protein
VVPGAVCGVLRDVNETLSESTVLYDSFLKPCQPCHVPTPRGDPAPAFTVLLYLDASRISARRNEHAPMVPFRPRIGDTRSCEYVVITRVADRMSDGHTAAVRGRLREMI